MDRIESSIFHINICCEFDPHCHIIMSYQSRTLVPFAGLVIERRNYTSRHQYFCHWFLYKHAYGTYHLTSRGLEVNLRHLKKKKIFVFVLFCCCLFVVLFLCVFFCLFVRWFVCFCLLFYFCFVWFFFCFCFVLFLFFAFCFCFCLFVFSLYICIQSWVGDFFSYSLGESRFLCL